MGISVIMPLYNAVQYLEQAVLSAITLEETHELIIIDDGSTDGSYALALQLAEQHDKVRTTCHPDHKNLGSSASRNLGIEEAQSEYIAFLDADDYYLAHRFAVALPYLIEHKEVGAVAESIEVIPGSSVIGNNLSDTMISASYTPRQLIKELMESSCFFLSLNGILARSSFIKEIGFFDERLKRTQDSDYVWRMALSHRLHTPFLRNPVAHYRRDNDHINRSDEVIIRNRIIFYDKWIKIALEERLSWRTLLILYKSQVYNICKSKNLNSLTSRLYYYFKEGIRYLYYFMILGINSEKESLKSRAYFSD